MDKNKWKEHFKEKGFYMMLLLCVVVVTITVTVLANRSNQEDLRVEKEREHSLVQNSSLTNDGFVEKDLAKLKEPKIIHTDEITRADLNSQKEAEKEKEKKQKQKQNQNTQEAQPTSVEPEVQPTFTTFKSSDSMAWPVDGAIVMAYSPKKLIYDVTLDLYRTNDLVSIEAVEGSVVKVAADGIIECVAVDERLGNYVVVNHGNGVRTTYGQLQENPDVKEKQKVKKGETIGKVAQPTKYSVGLGNHIDFIVTNEKNAVDPQKFLEKK